MSSKKHPRPPTDPWFSWTLLASIPKGRLLAIARQLGRKDPHLNELPPLRIAQQLNRLKRKVIGHLKRDELVAIAHRLGIVPQYRRKRDIAVQLVRKRQVGAALSRFSKYDGLPKELEEAENADLRAWVDYYIRNAEADGHIVNFCEDYSQTDPGHTEAMPESTIRLVCQAWPVVGWPEWLMWQTYDEPIGRGPWWIACDFENPTSWFGAKMILRDPWDFAFSDLFKASDYDNVSFQLCKPHYKPIADQEHRWLARAILDGMRYDFDDEDFILVCTKKPRSMEVHIYNPGCIEMRKNDKRDEDGIFWD
jgi:hypothetical protein